MAWYHQLTTKFLSMVPGLYRKFTLYSAGGDLPVDAPSEPWTPLETDPFRARLMLVTSGGVHGLDQTPFDMEDSRGDASYRWLRRGIREYEVTHDYYDHSDADRDLNCLFPLPLARQLSELGLIGELVERHPSFMGHIEDPLLPALMEESLPSMWRELEDRPDLVLLSPG